MKKLNGSLTVEASFLIPAAIILFSHIIIMSIRLYDNTVIESIAYIEQIKLLEYAELGDDRLNEIHSECEEALNNSLIATTLESYSFENTLIKYSINVKDSYSGERNSSIIKQDSAEYVRLTYFTKSVLGGDE